MKWRHHSQILRNIFLRLQGADPNLPSRKIIKEKYFCPYIDEIETHWAVNLKQVQGSEINLKVNKKHQPLAFYRSHLRGLQGISLQLKEISNHNLLRQKVRVLFGERNVFPNIHRP